MPPMRRKGDLPEKPCAVCGRPFAWRKKWAKVWDEVRYCSDACRAKRGDDIGRARRGGAKGEAGESDAVPERQRHGRLR
ncbi:DUF2256 domain-containing protein [Elioraea sp.]|uniref:DUF2256 domain-containing protein n=1 Tax=Elioraea sp. TaxID=2185103 RepID=UPI0025C0121D|nr:DUF2256 domain-containing protein [Elioraea sp.]